MYIYIYRWGNHVTIFRECGLDVRRYRYYDKKTNGLDMRGMMKDLNRAPDFSIVLFHACAHNPTVCIYRSSTPTQNTLEMRYCRRHSHFSLPFFFPSFLLYRDASM
jgi:aspartate/tyrosine/aromatic aminotransferase